MPRKAINLCWNAHRRGLGAVVPPPGRALGCHLLCSPRGAGLGPPEAVTARSWGCLSRGVFGGCWLGPPEPIPGVCGAGRDLPKWVPPGVAGWDPVPTWAMPSVGLFLG